MMSRSGAMGMQRLGAAMWSGDIGSDFGSLAAQMPNQMHMMWSGLDYYGSDVGGFHRGALGVYPGDHDDVMDELYTQWLAYSAMFEVPVRPHTENLCNCKETAPDRIGDLASNLANLKQRDLLTPYYYSLAYAAWRAGEPVFPSVDYWFPEAAEARELGHEKMIGPSLLSAAVAEFGAKEVEMFVPAGTWYVFSTGATVMSSGEMKTFPVYNGELFQLPLLARDGAVVPTKDNVLNVFGNNGSWFEWFDDDGVSRDYKTGGYDLVRVLVANDRVQIHRGSGFGIQPRELHWFREDFTPVVAVTINGTEVPFTQTNGEIAVELPTFSDRLVVELR
jgi:alpha-glucosidase